MRSFRRWCVLLAVCAGVFALACSDPDFNTDLDTQGPPEVTMVNVPSDTRLTFANGSVTNEVPTFCVEGSEFRVHREFCPPSEDNPDQRVFQEVTDAQPIGWYVRVVFSELLDPSVEELIECPGNPDATCGTLANTQPVTLTCGGAEVEYDGFYDPSGNDVTFPPGPGLIIQPTAAQPVTSGTQGCEVTVGGDVVDKKGEAVPEAFRGPYPLGVAAMAIAGTDPAPMTEGVDPTAAPTVQFNALVDPDTIAGNFTLHDDTNDNNVPVTAQLAMDPAGNPIPTTVEVVPNAGMLDPQTDYTLTVAATGIADILGGPLELDMPATVSFTTGDLPPSM